MKVKHITQELAFARIYESRKRSNFSFYREVMNRVERFAWTISTFNTKR